MFTKLIALTGAAALFAGLAQADLTLPFASPEFAGTSKGALTGNAGVDYSSKYISRGIALTDSETDHSVLFSAVGQYGLSDKNSIVGGASFNWLASKGLDHYDGHGLCDELSAVVEYAHRFSKRTVLAGGYQFVHGGLPGRLNYHSNSAANRDIPFFDSSRPEEHSLVLDFHHEFAKGLEGFFWDSRVQYSFRWVEGFWFANTFGYKHELNDKTDVIVSATWNASMNYFDSHTGSANGTQGYSLNISAPTMVNERLRVTPHAGMYFIGNGAEAANRYGVDTCRDFTFVVGVGASYVF